MLVLLAITVLVVLPLVLHRAWRRAFRSYREWADRSSQIKLEIADLRGRVNVVFEKYRDRRKGERFKRAYDLAGRRVRDLEEALSVGMYRERREVFVTAFIRNGVAVRVTASIGSPFRCSAADNPTLWKEHVERLRCDAIRQYHNHPVYDGSTQPSTTDFWSSQLLVRVLGPHGAKLQSFIIYWNPIREWKVIEYDESGRHWLHSEFDAAV